MRYSCIVIIWPDPQSLITWCMGSPKTQCNVREQLCWLIYFCPRFPWWGGDEPIIDPISRNDEDEDEDFDDDDDEDGDDEDDDEDDDDVGFRGREDPKIDPIHLWSKICPSCPRGNTFGTKKRLCGRFINSAWKEIINQIARNLSTLLEREIHLASGKEICSRWKYSKCFRLPRLLP